MKSPKIIALVQVLGLVAYVALFASFANTVPEALGLDNLNRIFQMMIFLLVFVLSALISSSLILGYPLLLLFRGEKNTAVKIILWCVVWIVIALLIFLGVVILLKS